MFIAEVWEIPKLPQELKDMIFEEAVPLHLKVKVHHVEYVPGGGAYPVIEAIEKSQWAGLMDVLTYPPVMHAAEAKLKKEGTLVVVDHALYYNKTTACWKEDSSGSITPAQARSLTLLPPMLLNLFRWAEVSHPHVFSFRRDEDTSAEEAMIRHTVRVPIPDWNPANFTNERDWGRPLSYELFWEINANSCPFYETEEVQYLFDHLVCTIHDKHEGEVEMYYTDLQDPDDEDSENNMDKKFLTTERLLAVMQTFAYRSRDDETWSEVGTSGYSVRFHSRIDAKSEYQKIGQWVSKWSTRWAPFEPEGLDLEAVDRLSVCAGCGFMYWCDCPEL